MTVAVCSWSLRATGAQELVERVLACGVGAVQLALDPIRRGEWDEEETVDALGDAGIAVVSGMMEMRGEDYSTLETIRRTGGVRADEHWDANRSACEANAALARRMGLGLVTLHAGFLPHDAHDPLRATMIGRLGEVADVFAAHGVRVGFETGQETAETLAGVLDELGRANVGINFDPANMILYGMGDCIGALAALLPRVVQAHIKDAIPSVTPGAWGIETPAGLGGVDWSSFFSLLERDGRSLDLCIEREGGDDCVGDVRRGVELIERLCGGFDG